VTAIAHGARLMVVTDRRMTEAAGRELVAVVERAVEGGAREVLLREKDLEPRNRHRLAVELRAVTAQGGAALYVASDVRLALAVGADGLQLAARDVWPGAGTRAALAARAPSHRMLLGRSCHSGGELVEAAANAADWATFSPVFATGSKPGYGPALGLDGLATGCRAVEGGLTVLALGGIGPGRAAGCTFAGAGGVAMMGAVMRADDPAQVVRAVADELRAAAAGCGGTSGDGAADLRAPR
jgi:thiamine-phosphate pyrophosphorylase